MVTNEKTMQYANFNITFGKNYDPMLMHFEDIIFPAFLSGYQRGTKERLPIYYFNEVQIREINGEYVLVGNFIKEDVYDVHTKVENGELVSAPAEVPTAPYSRFIVFLKNHRMILVRNERRSPDVRSFQTTVHGMLKSCLRQFNKEIVKEKRVPFVHVNIANIPLKGNIEEALSEARKINSIKFRFFPLNNDRNPSPIGEDIEQEMKRLESYSAHLQFTSPTDREEVANLIENVSSSGLAATTVKTEDKNGNDTTIKEDQFSSNKKIYLEGNIQSKNDRYIVEEAQKDSIISTVSQENASLYERLKDAIQRLIN